MFRYFLFFQEQKNFSQPQTVSRFLKTKIPHYYRILWDPSRSLRDRVNYEVGVPKKSWYTENETTSGYLCSCTLCTTNTHIFLQSFQEI